VIEEEEIAKENIAKGLPASKEESEKSIKVSPNDVFKISAGSEVYSEFKRDEFIKARDAALERGFKRTGIDLPLKLQSVIQTSLNLMDCRKLRLMIHGH